MPKTIPIRDLIIRLPVDPDLDQSSPPLSLAVSALLVSAGGVAGSLARAWIAHVLPAATHGWPIATLTVNVVGSMALGAVLLSLHELFVRARWARPLLGTGLCGGFTTFSTFAVEFTTRAANGHSTSAAAYVAVSLVASLLAGLAGVVMARAAVRLADRPAWHRRLEHAASLWEEDNA